MQSYNPIDIVYGGKEIVHPPVWKPPVSTIKAEKTKQMTFSFYTF